MIFSRFFITILFGTAATVYNAGAARSEFKVCNQTLNLYNVAIGVEKPALAIGTNKSGMFYTEGWWTIPANACVQLMKEKLTSRYIYLYAVNIYGDDSLSGNKKLCVGSKRFLIPHPSGELPNCWVKRYQEAGFKEIDTGRDADSWTVFIREN